MSTAAITETVSEKPKRGRPEAFDRELYAFAAQAMPDTKTRRGRQNTLYMFNAMAALGNGEDERFHWLHPSPEQCNQGAKLRMRILSELGRIEDDDDLREMAELICQRKPTATMAVNWIRRYRGVAKAEGSCLQLSREIAAVVSDYCNRHTETTTEQVVMALQNAIECVEAK